MIKYFALIGLLITSSYSFSAVVYDATIKEVYCGFIANREMCSIYISKEVDDSCNTGGGNSKSRMQFEIKTEMDKAMLSIILTAKTTQSLVVVASKTTCLIYPGISDLAYIEMK